MVTMREDKVILRRGGKRGALRALFPLALVVTATLFYGLMSPAHALVNPIMHNGSSTTSTKWGGGWGNTPTSKYGRFTCSTCHTAGLSVGNAKQIKSTITAPNSPTDNFPGSTVAFNSWSTYGSDTAHGTSQRVCEVCHTLTTHHKYNNAGANHNGNVDCTQCHKHSSGFKGGGESSGGSACSTCHSDLYGSNGDVTQYGMHSNVASISYKHYMDNDNAATNNGLAGGTLGTSFYNTVIPNGTSTNTLARRCLMCHVDHDQFKVTSTGTAGRGFNLRDRADVLPTKGSNDDYNLCLSCHVLEKTKYVVTPNGNTKVMPVPYPGLTYANATSVLTFSTHGYGVFSKYSSGSLGTSQFKGICVKCHNDSFGGNGDLGNKSSVGGQDSTIKFGEHNSTLPSRFSVFSNSFYQRPASGTTLAYNAAGPVTITITPSPGWAVDEHINHTVVVTSGLGNNQRMRVTTNTVDTLTLYAAFSTAIDDTSKIDIANDSMAVDNVCFSCHSQAGQDKPTANTGKDWYGQQPMKSALEGIKNLFIGDSGTSTGFTLKVTLADTTKAWTASQFIGYQLKIKSGANSGQVRTISANTTNSVTVSSGFSSNLASGLVYEIVKPASHPLDSYGRHDSYERVSATSGWNQGDQGTATAASATSITDTSRLWSGSEFTGMYIWFPGKFDSSGNPANSLISNGGAGVVNFATITGYTPAIGDNYYIGYANGGGRHVSCADCHNTHATFSNPEGTVTNSTATTMTANDSINVKGWSDNKWTGFLLKVLSTTGAEQIRYITAFNKASGQYTVSLAWDTNPDSTYTYEVLMSTKWTAAGMSGGRAGSGSSGVWGTVVTQFPTITRGDGTLTSVPLANFKKIENVFDNVSSTGLGGSTIAGQHDLCIRCHSNYAYGTATPMTPSGGWTSTYNTTGPARSTDVGAEFNPQNVAHHAVYARGNNQPITPTGTTSGATSYYNTNWPAYSTGTITINTNGTASISGGTLPSTVLPGWYVYRGTLTSGKPPATATSGYYQITSITSTTAFTVTPNPATTQTGAYAVTAGLGNNFVPPYGPWSILRCTDCHGSTKTDPVGPHASINKWLIKDASTNLQFQWYNGTSPVTINYQSAANIDGTNALTNTYDKGYFCFNCHRADVYGIELTWSGGKTPVNALMARVSHGQLSVADGSHIYVTRGGTKGTAFPQFCRHCHGGDKIGGIHGSNRAQSAQGDARPQSVRFLNGATWNNGIGITAGKCYTQSASTGVSGCSQHGTGTNNTFTVNYTYTGY